MQHMHKTTKMPAKEKKESLQGAAKEQTLSSRFTGNLSNDLSLSLSNQLAFYLHPNQTNYTNDVW